MNRRRLALWFLLIALITILVIGFYLGSTHQEPRPSDDGASAMALSAH